METMQMVAGAVAMVVGVGGVLVGVARTFAPESRGAVEPALLLAAGAALVLVGGWLIS